jgi:hypothetical protein
MIILFSRFRVLIAALSIAIFLLVFNTANLCYHSTSAAWLVDISFWLLSIGSIVAELLDLSLILEENSSSLNPSAHDCRHRNCPFCQNFLDNLQPS